MFSNNSDQRSRKLFGSYKQAAFDKSNSQKFQGLSRMQQAIKHYLKHDFSLFLNASKKDCIVTMASDVIIPQLN